MLHEVNKWSQEPASLFDNLHQFLRRADAESNSTDGGFERHLWQSVHCLFLLTSGVGGLVWVPIVRACNEGSPRPRVARAQGIGRLPFFPFFSLSSSLVLEGSGQGCPRLRASNEGLPRPRVLRARRAPGYSLSDSCISFSTPRTILIFEPNSLAFLLVWPSLREGSGRDAH